MFDSNEVFEACGVTLSRDVFGDPNTFPDELVLSRLLGVDLALYVIVFERVGVLVGVDAECLDVSSSYELSNDDSFLTVGIEDEPSFDA